MRRGRRRRRDARRRKVRESNGEIRGNGGRRDENNRKDKWRREKGCNRKIHREESEIIRTGMRWRAVGEGRE